MAEAIVVAKEPQPAAQAPLPQRQPKEALSNNMNNMNDQKIGVVNPVVVNKTPVNAVKANVEPAAKCRVEYAVARLFGRIGNELNAERQCKSADGVK